LKLHLFSIRMTISLILTAASQVASAVLPPDVREADARARQAQADEARERAPVVLDIHVDDTERRGPLYIARARVLEVVRSPRPITKGGRVVVEYRDISSGARRFNAELQRDRIPGPGFKPVLYLLKRNDSVRAYLKPLADRAGRFTLGAGIDSYSSLPAPSGDE